MVLLSVLFFIADENLLIDLLKTSERVLKMSHSSFNLQSRKQDESSFIANKAHNRTDSEFFIRYRPNTENPSLASDIITRSQHKNKYPNMMEGTVTTYPVEEPKKKWITERLHYAMVEALFKQGLLSEVQRRELCVILKCDILNTFNLR